MKGRNHNTGGQFYKTTKNTGYVSAQLGTGLRHRYVGIFVGILILMVIDFDFIGIMIALAALFGGIAASMAWKNQSIRILNTEQFVYRTFLGNEHIYRFQDITHMRTNTDSSTLFLKDGKIHIERCAVMSERLARRIDEALQATESPI